ncbi:MAG TPA: thiamine pyrophosphate-dependent dehydrogenase E1 component subunit alpha [Chloroflexota bacterium]|nr:thiamine pyrophosphate-dependent dehydrogenase E1 component subunit alpha [Chloroflexota bacterium]
MVSTRQSSDALLDRIGLHPNTLVELYRYMLLSRALDVRAWALSRQGRARFVITSRGHEAAQIGLAFALDRGRDWICPYYRDMALVLGIGMTAREIMLTIFAKATDLCSGGRQLPMHFSHPRWRIISGSSVVSTQILHAVGLALSAKLSGEDVVAVTCFGDGGSSKGDFHEGLNFAAVHRLPVIFFCENNGYAISVPQHKQMAIRDVASRAAGYGMPGVVVDGGDPIAVYQAVREARNRALAGDGPTLIEAKVARFTAHSSDDDDRLYRPREEVEAALANDPIPAFARRLKDLGFLDETTDRDLQASVVAEVDEAVAFAEAAPEPEVSDLLTHVFAEEGESP